MVASKDGGSLADISCTPALVFLILMVRSESLHDREEQSISRCRGSSVWGTRAASSRNNMPRTTISDTLPLRRGVQC